MKKIISITVIIISLACHSQTNDFKTFLRTNKFKLVDIKYNMHSHMEDIDKGYFYTPANNYRSKMEMKAIIYDTSNVEHVKLLKKLKFKLKDTVLVYDWDLQADAIPTAITASNYKYNKADSSLIFYNAQDIIRHFIIINNPNRPVRKFKVILVEKDRFTLLDKDLTDVKRTYFFKKISVK